MSSLYLKTHGPAILVKFLTNILDVLSYLEDTGKVYDSIYVEDTGGLGGDNEGMDWLATNTAKLERKVHNVRGDSYVNGFDYILDQTKPVGDYDLSPITFQYQYDKTTFNLYGKYLKINSDLMGLVHTYNSLLGITDNKTLGVQLRTTDINHWHREDGQVTYDELVSAVKTELKRGDYDQIYLASDNIRDSILFEFEVSKIVPVKSILHLCQDYIAPRSPDFTYFYNYVKQNYTYKDSRFWVVTFLDFLLLTLTDKKILRINSANHCVIKSLGSLMSSEILVPEFKAELVGKEEENSCQCEKCKQSKQEKKRLY